MSCVNPKIGVLSGLAGAGVLCVIGAAALISDFGWAPWLAGSPRMISYDRLPEEEGEACAYEPVSETVPGLGNMPLRTALLQLRVAQAETEDLSQRKPLRMIRDSYAAYSAVAVDNAHNEVVLTDENLFNLWIFEPL